jgi:hypothetical protein
MSENRYNNLVKTSLEIIRNSHVPLRSSKYSNKKYTQHQLLTLIILKEGIRMNYRDFSEILQILTPIREILRLKDIPHFTTVQKFLSRIPALTFCIILKNVIRSLHYKGRNMVKIVFSVIKRRYGENVRSRKYCNQLKEIKIRIILHNMTL